MTHDGKSPELIAQEIWELHGRLESVYVAERIADAVSTGGLDGTVKWIRIANHFSNIVERS